MLMADISDDLPSVDEVLIANVRREMERLIENARPLPSEAAAAVWRAAFLAAIPRYPMPESWRHPAFCDEMARAAALADGVLAGVSRAGIADPRVAQAAARQAAALLRTADQRAALKARLCAAVHMANERMLDDVAQVVILSLPTAVVSLPARVVGAAATTLVLVNVALVNFCKSDAPRVLPQPPRRARRRPRRGGAQ